MCLVVQCLRPERRKEGIGTFMREIGCRQWQGLMGRRPARMLAVVMLWAGLFAGLGARASLAQENPLGQVPTQPPPPPPKTPEDAKPVIEGAENAAALATSRRDARIRVDVNLVLVPATV